MDATLNNKADYSQLYQLCGFNASARKGQVSHRKINEYCKGQEITLLEIQTHLIDIISCFSLK